VSTLPSLLTSDADALFSESEPMVRPKGRDDALPGQPGGQPGGIFGAGGAAGALRLINRCTFGFTPYEAGRLARLGPRRYVEEQLDPASIPDTALDAFIFGTPTRTANYPALALSPAALAAQTSATDVRNQLQRARLMRAIFSRRQLLERVVDLWTDHFNININDSDLVRMLKVLDDRDVIRANALGTFPALLLASARSPAMSAYLNNDENRVGAPNENYAREIMELHTLSVTGGYSQQDVQQVARCFTGWRYVTSSSSPDRWTFFFDSSRHDTGSKTVLGQVIPARTGASGQQDGVDVVNILAAHPSTARFIAGKVLTEFWGYSPPAGLVETVASIYSATGGDIKAMLAFVLLDPSVPAPTDKFKRPVHLLASMLRGLGAGVVSPNNLQSPLSQAGHQPYEWGPPDGYPDAPEAWMRLLLPRWNFGAALMNSEYGSYTANPRTGVHVDHVAFLKGASTATAIVDRVSRGLFNGLMPYTERARLTSYLTAGTLDTTRTREALGLAVSTPAFQWY
jgi:uncharacterized protein (DUF1800 family)